MTGEPAKPSGAAEAIFHAALERPVADRGSFLEEACGADARLRDRVEALLRAHEAPDGFLPEAPGPSPPASSIQHPVSSASEQPGETIGRYKLIRQIGEGGWG